MNMTGGDANQYKLSRKQLDNRSFFSFFSCISFYLLLHDMSPNEIKMCTRNFSFFETGSYCIATANLELTM